MDGGAGRLGRGKAFGTGALLAALNPKNTLLAVSAAATIAQTGIPGGEQAFAYGAFALLGTVGVEEVDLADLGGRCTSERAHWRGTGEIRRSSPPDEQHLSAEPVAGRQVFTCRG